MRIMVSPMLPAPGAAKFRLSDNVMVSDEFRRSFDSWAIGFFGRGPDVHCLVSDVAGVTYLSAEAYGKLAANTVLHRTR